MRLVVVLVAVSAGCAGPGAVLDLADAETPEGRGSAVAAASAILHDRGEQPGRRVAGALVLGRLRRPTPAAVRALARGLGADAPPAVRAASAWALGELRDEASLEVLLEGLRRRPGAALGQRLLQGIARHHALLAARPDLSVRAVEAMSHFSGSLTSGELPPAFDLVGARIRSLEVDVAVLDGALRAHRADGSPATAGALYAAAFELLARLDRLRAELTAARASTRAEEAIRVAAGALAAGDPAARRLVLWFLGVLADEPLYARAAAAAIRNAPDRHGSGSDRLLAAWALARGQLRALEARRSLAVDVVPTEADPALLRVLVAPGAPDEPDLLQRILGVEVPAR